MKCNERTTIDNEQYVGALHTYTFEGKGYGTIQIGGTKKNAKIGDVTDYNEHAYPNGGEQGGFYYVLKS